MTYWWFFKHWKVCYDNKGAGYCDLGNEEINAWFLYKKYSHGSEQDVPTKKVLVIIVRAS